MEINVLQNNLPKPEAQLNLLADSLPTLLAEIKAGHWERFAELAERLAPTMDAVQNAANQRQINSTDHRQKIDAVLTMLHTAISECSARKEQILPLIEAFNKVSDSTHKP